MSKVNVQKKKKEREVAEELGKDKNFLGGKEAESYLHY